MTRRHPTPGRGNGTITALVVTADDALLAEMALPERWPSIRMVKQVRHPWTPNDHLAAEPSVVTVDFWLDEADSLAQQLLRGDPDVAVYREHP